jgi:cyclic beta-1,2-glucan synthetase
MSEPALQPEPFEMVARELAELHVVSSQPAKALPVWTERRATRRWLDRARMVAAEPPPGASKAAEWLLDNDYQIHRAIQQIARDLPAGFYRRLPSLEPGREDAGLPRIFVIAHGLLHASHLQLSLQLAVRFIQAYQTQSPLTIAELWAFPTMLRLACLEILVSSFSRLFPDLPPPFQPARHPRLTDTFDDSESASRALATLSIIASVPWKEFFDRVSHVEATLLRDPSEFYAQMDFETRDRYRQRVEELSQGSGRSETDIAEAVVARSLTHAMALPGTHLGYWLVGDGKRSFELALGYRASLTGAFARVAMRHAGPLYASSLAVVAVMALFLPGAFLAIGGASPVVWMLGLLLSLVPASVLGVTVVHWMATQIVPPRILPKLDFEKAIPADCAAAVVMPVLVSGPDGVAPVLERLEAHWLTNPDPSLHYVLLSDHADASAETMPCDAKVETALVNGIRQLNRRYGAGGQAPFCLLHRRRRHSPHQNCWMAWERKRGKLEQFNRFVLGEEVADFALCEGAVEALRAVRFVVTLDADTRIQQGTVARLVGTLAHPLNTARFDPATGRVRSGYTVLQPRVEISPDSGNRSLFARLYTGDTAIDIYSRAVSDVYQDLFGSGIYIGKGIYEIETFQRSLEGRVPENALLSHDLFEGSQGRAGLASDIVVYESFPAGYIEYMRRWHRWVRGDWQLVPWLWAQVPGRDGRRIPNRLSLLSRWKIFDNLRRSLVPVALVALAAAGWLVLPGSPWVWTALAIAVPAASLFTDLVSGLAHGRRRGAVRSLFRRLTDHAGRWFLAITFLVQDAAVALDAIVRTLWRLLISRRNLLEWTPAAHTAVRFASSGSRADAWRHMWAAPVFSGGLATALVLLHPQALAPAAPLLLLWLLSPEFAAIFGRPRPLHGERIDEGDRAFLRRLARRTWLYFETFVGPEDNWLPPDNVQEEPHAEIAHRTSPTNVGMMLLSSLSAWDLGYIGSNELAVRVRNALDTLDRLERHRGHILNWYDTRSLAPLEPRYVSTVDSGNLAACLVTLSEGCLDATKIPAIREVEWDGLSDEIDLLARSMNKIAGQGSRFQAAVAILSERARIARDSPDKLASCLAALASEDYREIDAAIREAFSEFGETRTEDLREVNVWLERVHHHVASIRRDLEYFRPWQSLIETAPPECAAIARRLAEVLPASMPIGDTGKECEAARAALALLSPATGKVERQWLRDLDSALKRGALAQKELLDGLFDVAARARDMAFAMDYRFLFDPETRLFHIGYNVSASRIDTHHYDLLASEARLASFFAIAKGDVPAEHWFFLGRPMTTSSVGPALISWNGSMFEYLMPPLLMKSDPGTMLGQSERAAVELQRSHASTLNIPWGVSESGFASRDTEFRYRYRAFGTPGLGLRRGLSRDLVVAPYASALALCVSPRQAAKNLRELERLGARGRYGLREALDFTAERFEPDRRFALVRSYMAHHQGMTLAALNNAISSDVLVRRFHADPRLRAIELLLHERVPWEFPPEIERPAEREPPSIPAGTTQALHPWVPAAAGLFPQVHILGNGRLAAAVSDAGAGGLWWQKYALTRWRPDAVGDNHGLWIYVQDTETGSLWSAGRQPTGAAPEEATVVFHPHLAEFCRRDHGIFIRMEVGIAGGDDIEIRRLTIVNQTDRPRSLQLTSLGEVVLTPPLDDERHQAFSKLFVGSEYLPGLNGLIFERRPRHPGETPPALLHRLVTDDPDIAITGFDCDRMSVLGRNGNLRRPLGVTGKLSGNTGWTLDPVMTLQLKLDFEPHQSRQFALLTMAAGSRQSVLELADRYATLGSLEWALGNADTDVAREVQQLGLEPDRLPELQVLASLLLHPHPAMRADQATIAANRLGQPRLWALGLSGDRPILVLRMADASDAGLLRLLVQGHQYWRKRGLIVDLVILRSGLTGYIERVRDQLFAVLREAGVQELLARDGGIHLIFADHVAVEDCRLLESTARVVLDANQGTLGQQLASVNNARAEPPAFTPNGHPASSGADLSLARPKDLLFDNGLGGFTEDGREYVIHLEAGETTPAPWANVLANDEFGAIVTEAGLGFTWAINSGENRLTPWSNDPVVDRAGESIYLRDEETAGIWTPTPQPAFPGTAACQIRHGAGHTTWLNSSHGLEQELLAFVPIDAPVKLVRLRLRNQSPHARRITATYYAEWVLGALPSVSRPAVVCEYDASCHALLARNPWNPDFSERTAFLTSSRPPHSLTADRQAFLGREGDPGLPAALLRWGLGDQVSPGLDPCAAYQVHLDIAPGGSEEVVFVLGQGNDRAHAIDLVRQWQDRAQVEEALRHLYRQWDKRLGAVGVTTPDPGFDIMVNRWLLYQTISSRIMSRAGFYQAGGAIGFRDQLQDVMALFISDPGRARSHILACAARQFEEGDVLHWWHPPYDRGVRTRCSDDLLWLPYVTGCYVDATGDRSILQEMVPFLRGPPLADDEDDRYARFETTAEQYSLFEHCERAVDKGITEGAHGLPLIGTGDWNDGMDRVGRAMRGESVWLAWFAIATLRSFAKLSEHTGRADLAERWTARATRLQVAVESAGWDGGWYRRAFDDDGRPWGSAANDECRIDLIAQSWAVISGGAEPERARMAVAAANEQLLREDDGLIRLLWPPFDKTPRDPGYIKAYPPGIRENAGQYTHAAAWLGFAFAGLGDGRKAAQVFAMLSPLTHASTPMEVKRYRVEPYVVAADVAGVRPHVGRGGWTWYTGSAAWTWRLGVEAILGLRLRGGELAIEPCLPGDWGWFEAEVKGAAGTLAIRVEDPHRLGRGRCEITVDDMPLKTDAVAFPSDGSVRHVLVRIVPLHGSPTITPE